LNVGLGVLDIPVLRSEPGGVLVHPVRVHLHVLHHHPLQDRAAVHPAASGPHHRQKIRFHCGNGLPVLDAHCSHQGHCYGR